MKITPDQASSPSMQPSSPAANQAKSERVSTPSTTASAVEKAATSAGTAIVPPPQRQTDVTFKRDGNGRIYYVVADAHSGQEILELPTKAVRDAGQGIEDYLKQEGSKTNSHIEVKA